MADLYVHLSRIWRSPKATKPFHLKRKEGLWKQIDQPFLADGLGWSVKTVSRNLDKLSRAGLIRYERHGYIAKKYLQLRTIEEALALGVTTSSPHQDEHDATQVSVTYRTRSSLAIGHDVRSRSDKMSESNTERTHTEGLNTENKPEELRAPQRVAPPSPVGQKVQLLEAAIALYEAKQREFDGIRTDGRTLDSLKQQVIGLTDDEVAHACGIALHLTNAWAWSKHPGYASTHSAGETISAVLGGRAWSPFPGTECTPDVGETFSWDNDLETFVDEHGYDVFGECLVEDVLEPPSAVNRERPPELPRAHVDAALDTFDSQSTRPIEACLPVTAPPSLQVMSTPSNRREVQHKSYGSVEEQLARLKATRPDLYPSSQSPGRHGSSQLDDDAGCGDTYFNDNTYTEPDHAYPF